jgi:hypothetical protein
MTRRQPLRVLLPNTVSHAVMDFAGHPFMFSFGLDGAYQDYSEADWAGAKPLSFLAWVNLWIRLALGLEIEADGPRAEFVKFDVPRIRPRQVKAAAVRRPPARNLEALMRFVPGARRGLTLNQYRERLTRISVLGRFQIYHWLSRRRGYKRRSARTCLSSRGGLGKGLTALCLAAPWPD